MAETDTEPGAPPRLLIIIAAGLAIALAVAVAVAGLLAGGDDEQPPAAGPLPLVPVPAPQAGTPQCSMLISAAPSELTSKGAKLAKRELAAPAPQATSAWGDKDPVVLRCGLDRPPELTPTSALRVINGVQWLEVPGQGASTWYVVDRAVYVALTVPADTGTGPLQEISTLVGTQLPPQPLRFGAK